MPEQGDILLVPIPFTDLSSDGRRRDGRRRVRLVVGAGCGNRR